jgi:hypothetical protein
MLITKKAESLAGIIVWIFILSFVLLGIGTLIWSSKDLISRFDKKMDLDLLTSSSYNVLNNLDLSSLNIWNIFYLYKNEVTKEFTIEIWSWEVEYKYIDKYWSKIANINSFEWDIYLRESEVKDKIIETNITRSWSYQNNNKEVFFNIIPQ